MIASDFIKEYEEVSNGYALFVEKCPSLTPLNVDMTSKNLKEW